MTPEQELALVAAFAQATEQGDIDAVRDLLAADAIMYSDGGGVVTAARKPIYGAAKIARFMVRIRNKTTFPDDTVSTPVRVNGDPGVRLDSPTEGLLGVLALELSADVIVNVRIVLNPEKLTRLPARTA